MSALAKPGSSENLPHANLYGHRVPLPTGLLKAVVPMVEALAYDAHLDPGILDDPEMARLLPNLASRLGDDSRGYISHVNEDPTRKAVHEELIGTAVLRATRSEQLRPCITQAASRIIETARPRRRLHLTGR